MAVLKSALGRRRSCGAEVLACAVRSAFALRVDAATGATLLPAFVGASLTLTAVGAGIGLATSAGAGAGVAISGLISAFAGAGGAA